MSSATWFHQSLRDVLPEFEVELRESHGRTFATIVQRMAQSKTLARIFEVSSIGDEQRVRTAM